MEAITHTHSEHDHAQELRDYYIEQLLSVFISGAFGVTGVLMYKFDMLKFILAEPFRPPVLYGGIGLIGLALFRGIALWFAVGGDHFHDHHIGHNHAPGEPCDQNAEDDHGHDEHSHGGAYWRIVVLLFPVLLFVMGVPNGAYSADYVIKMAGQDSAIGEIAEVADKGGGTNVYDFASLSLASNSPEKREELTGTKASIKGQIVRVPNSSTEFTLIYVKITCCGSDAVTLKARVKAGSSSLADMFDSQCKITPQNGKPALPWVEVTGTLQFVQDSQGTWITVLRVKDNGGITPTMPVN